MLDNLPDFLERWDDGSIRLTGHRISLFVILTDHREGGMTAEEIEAEYPTLAPGHVAKVLAFCRENQTEADRYYEESKAIGQKNLQAIRNGQFGRRPESWEERIRRYRERHPGPLPDYLQAFLDRNRS